MKNGKREKKPLSASESRQVVVLHPPVNFFSICLSRIFLSVGLAHICRVSNDRKRESRVHLNQDRRGKRNNSPVRDAREKERVRPREKISRKNKSSTHRSTRRKTDTSDPLCGRLMLGWHPVANSRNTWILRTSLLLLLQVLVVRRHLLLLLVRHVGGVHSRGTRDVGLLSSINIVMVDILWSLCRHFGSCINSVLIGSRIGSIETGLWASKGKDESVR